MEEQKWEFCRLRLRSWNEEKDGIKYDLALTFFSANDSKPIILATTEKGGRKFSYNPFSTAMGYLGSFGWDLVSVQHGNTSGGQFPGGSLKGDDIVAYFKRPILPGRKVDEPAIVLP